jgi:hypothetical protein
VGAGSGAHRRNLTRGEAESLGDAVLRVHFTTDDLTSTRPDAAVDAGWEMVSSRLRLCERHRASAFTSWGRQVQRGSGGAGPGCVVDRAEPPWP